MSAEAAERRAPTSRTINLSLAAMCLIWGSTWLIIREGLEDLPPLTSLAIRFSLAAAIFVVIAPFFHRREGGQPPPLWLSLFMGVVDLAIPYGVVYWVETVLPSGLTAVLWAVFPMFVAVLAHVFLPEERLGAGNRLGFILGFLGVVLLFLTDLQGIGNEALRMGLLLMISPLAAAFGVTLIKRYGKNVSSVLLNRNGLVLASAALWCVALPVERGAELHWTGSAIFSVLYLAVMGTVVTFGLFYWVMRYAPAFKLSLISYVIPFIALLLGSMVGSERVGPHTLGGTALIVLGVFLACRP